MKPSARRDSASASASVAATAKVLAAVGIAAVGATLSGCDSNLMQGPASIGFAGDDLIVAVCEDITANSVSVSYRQGSFGALSELALEQRGEVELVAGDTFEVEVGVAGMSPESGTGVDLVLPSGIVVQVHSDEGDITAAFNLDADGVPDGMWLRPDGRMTEVPCG